MHSHECFLVCLFDISETHFGRGGVISMSDVTRCPNVNLKLL